MHTMLIILAPDSFIYLKVKNVAVLTIFLYCLLGYCLSLRYKGWTIDETPSHSRDFDQWCIYVMVSI